MNWKTAALAVALAAASSAARGDDPVARELDVVTAQAAAPREGDAMWANVQPGLKDLTERSRQALSAGLRRAALYRLSAARQMYAAWRYVDSHAEARTQAALFEAEWKRAGDELAATQPLATRGDAFLRALAEAAAGEVRPYYEASLEYGQATQPLFGLYYIGSAFAARDTDAFTAGLATVAPGAAPPIRSIAGELDALEAELLAAYKPPVSIDRHPRFIAASGALKQARELDAAGLHHGALLRYLEAALRSATLRGSPAPLDATAARARAALLEPRLAAADHSLARLFVEVALSDAANPGADSRGALTAGIVFADLVPRYFAALAAAAPRPPAPAAQATVTLVRWPYT